MKLQNQMRSLCLFKKPTPPSPAEKLKDIPAGIQSSKSNN
ncbi:hypothetical protein HU200_058880 [Digitaria exilis]|uniref:Uncharacterized protein n=1 Tax=Digitaria exilis TaxID=1010633 RepID=A0A835ADD3_9POAL|nr:hypothetical protein HU200_058880 [Digitaria exilis]